VHLLLATTSSAADALGAVGALTVFIFALGMIAVMMIPYFRIVSKAGYSGWLCLLMLIPLVNLVMLWIFAFSTWPVEQRPTPTYPTPTA